MSPLRIFTHVQGRGDWCGLSLRAWTSSNAYCFFSCLSAFSVGKRRSNGCQERVMFVMFDELAGRFNALLGPARNPQAHAQYARCDYCNGSGDGSMREGICWKGIWGS